MLNLVAQSIAETASQLWVLAERGLAQGDLTSEEAKELHDMSIRLRNTAENVEIAYAKSHTV
jgi:polyhydroxyalkanoate synthesis regulator phasin